MSSSKVGEEVDIDIGFSPFYAIFKGSVDRLFEFMKRESFTFFVNGTALESTVVEAIAISPTVFECLRTNPLSQSFSITSDAVDSTTFSSFLDFARCRDLVRIRR
jgi:hypothetical protein